MRDLGVELAGFTRIDPDIIKADLLAGDKERWKDLMDNVLPDGRTVRLAELATLVHEESTQLAMRIFMQCLTRGMNVVIEGTLRWDGQGANLMNAIAYSGVDYRQLDIIDVEVTKVVALQQAAHRWWDVRNHPEREDDWKSPGEGRFTPARVIEELYHESQYSACKQNARQMYERADVRLLPNSRLILVDRVRENALVELRNRIDGTETVTTVAIDSIAPDPLGALT